MKKAHFAQIDWNKAWKKVFSDSTRNRDAEFWDQDSEWFNLQPLMDDYTRKALTVFKVAEDHTVLDIGCGVGNIAIPLAKKVKNVTALDISEKMLVCLQQKARQAGVNNINCIHKDWLTVKVGDDIFPHDVVISSRSIRSLISTNPREAIAKMDQVARNKVYIVWEVSTNPYYKKVCQIIGRKVKERPSHIYLYNLLFQMGIYAQVEIVEGVRQSVHQSLDKSVEFWRRRMGGLSTGEEKELRDYFSKELLKGDEYLRQCEDVKAKWAFIWWEKQRTEDF